jgi:hypothetical protein
MSQTLECDYDDILTHLNFAEEYQEPGLETAENRCRTKKEVMDLLKSKRKRERKEGKKMFYRHLEGRQIQLVEIDFDLPDEARGLTDPDFRQLARQVRVETRIVS